MEETNYNDIVFMTRAGSSVISSSATLTLTTTSTPSSSPVYSGNFSLAEHSYCASLNPHSPEGVGTHCNVAGSADTLIPHGEFSMDFGEDVNFDGFNFAIPLHESVGRGVGASMEVEGGFQWRVERPGEGGDLCDLTTGEVTSSCSVTVPGSDIVRFTGGASRIGKDIEQQQQSRQANIGQDDKKTRTGRRAKAVLRKYSRPRRRDYIENPGEREKFFELVLKKLTLQLRRVCCRTGCEGDLSAVFDGKVFNSSPTLTSSNPLDGPTVQNVSSHHTDLQLSNACITTTSTLNRLEVDDHRYAAIMSAQTVKASEVWDHQYAYEGKLVVPDMERQERDIGSRDIKPDQTKRVERLDFIKREGAREQTLCKFANSMFSQKNKLEQRTGANVYLILKYGRYIINDKNYQDCSQIITSGKKVPTQKVLQQLAPKPEEQELVPLTFILPGCHPIRIPVSISGSQTTAPVPSSFPTPVYQVMTSSRSSNSIMLPVYSTEIGQPNVLGTQTEDPQIEQDAMDLEVSGNFLEFNPNGSYSTVDSNSFNQGSPRQETVTTSSAVGNAVGMQESSTNTEPICSVCQNESMHSYSSGTCSKVKSSFWIRCNDPFCYDMVHASCVGFMVTHAAHLRQLPPFYCNVHR